MPTIAVISMLAVAAGIGGYFPQIVAMFQARSAAGQSAFGWCLGVLGNGLLAYVNAVHTHSEVLAAGNALGFALCLLALAQVMLYRSRNRPAAEVAAIPAVTVTVLLDSPQEALAELHTTELEALSMVVLDAQEARRRFSEPVAAAA